MPIVCIISSERTDERLGSDRGFLGRARHRVVSLAKRERRRQKFRLENGWRLRSSCFPKERLGSKRIAREPSIMGSTVAAPSPTAHADQQPRAARVKRLRRNPIVPHTASVGAVVAFALWLFHASLGIAAALRPGEMRVSFPGHAVVLVAEVADTREKRTRGLGGRDHLPDGRGMLFVFDKTTRAGFWMKGMRFAIDILWFDDDLRLVSIAHDATPESYPGVFRPKRPARYVLEVPAGFVSRNQVELGDIIRLSPFPPAKTGRSTPRVPAR
jgi:uncharacterized membrane protein (UPF0127 family)